MKLGNRAGAGGEVWQALGVDSDLDGVAVNLKVILSEVMYVILSEC